MTPFTLLHIGDHAARVITLDAAIVSFAVAAFAAACFAIWRLDLTARMLLIRRRGRRRIAGVLVAVLVALAVLPAVIPYDHLIAPPGEAHAASASVGDEVHTTHCHGSPASCSDIPLLSGPGQFLMHTPLLIVPAMLSVILAVAVVSLTGRTPTPEKRPPLLVSNLSPI